MNCTLVIPDSLHRELFAHLFPGDGDEHGAVIAAGIAKSAGGLRLLARNLFLARDGKDYVPGQRGYRMLRAEFITDKILFCRDERLAYLAVHNHGGRDQVTFSGDDFASHERGYPALLQVLKGLPVGGVVFARNAAAGDIWLSKTDRISLSETRIQSTALRRLYPRPRRSSVNSEHEYDRQSRLFGDAGQRILSRAKVGIVGVGGIGSLLVEYLARLGVGRIVAIDLDRVDVTNLPRIVGATRWDARTLITAANRPAWLRALGKRMAARKVAIGKRVTLAANPNVRFDAIFGDVTEEATARLLTDCDYLFLAADSFQARLVFNAIVHQFLIPGVQVGAKVRVDRKTGDLVAVYSVSRPILPTSGCLWCNGLIPPAKLQEESATPEERETQRYVEDSAVEAPSVITLNATVASIAANDFLFWFTGLTRDDSSLDYIRFRPRRREVWSDKPRRDLGCPECSETLPGRFARGDSYPLPTKEGR